MSETKTESRNHDYVNDQPREWPIIERKREWEHPQDGDCSRKAKPIHTDPQALPDRCGSHNPWGGGCGRDEWRSKGIVLRDQRTKQIVHREGETK